MFKKWVLLTALNIFVFPLPSFAQNAGDACTSTNQIVRENGVNPKAGIICNGTTYETFKSVATSPFRNGIGIATPEATLHIDGEVIIGNTSLVCSGTTEGAMRYSSTEPCMQFCDGTSWACIAPAACADTTPAGFAFTDLVNQSVSTLVSSNILQITGLLCGVNVAVSGEGSPQYRICSNSGCSTVVQDWTSLTATLFNNDYLQLRLTTSAVGGDIFTATVAVGNGSDVWNATPTGDCTGSPAVGTVCADGSVYAGLSPDGNVKMYVTRCDAGMSWDGSACTGSRFLLTWNNGDTNYVTTGYTSSITGEDNTVNIAPIDSDNVLAGNQSHVAVDHCNDLSENGNSDWYLPATQELNVIYDNKIVIANFITTGTYYWSSSENTNGYAWSQRFSDGSQDL